MRANPSGCLPFQAGSPLPPKGNDMDYRPIDEATAEWRRMAHPECDWVGYLI